MTSKTRGCSSLIHFLRLEKVLDIRSCIVLIHLSLFFFEHSSFSLEILDSNDSDSTIPVSIASLSSRVDFFLRLGGGAPEKVASAGVLGLLRNLNLSLSFDFHEPYNKLYIELPW